MNYLRILGSKRDLSIDLEQVKLFSEKIDKKLSKSKIPLDSKIDKLSFEELQDLNKIVALANFVLCKYEDKKETHSILKYFVSVINESTEFIEGIDDEISHLILSAEDSINKIKDMHLNISEKSDISDTHNELKSLESSSINLTNFTTEINTLEYQQNFQKEVA